MIPEQWQVKIDKKNLHSINLYRQRMGFGSLSFYDKKCNYMDKQGCVFPYKPGYHVISSAQFRDEVLLGQEENVSENEIGYYQIKPEFESAIEALNLNNKEFAFLQEENGNVRKVYKNTHFYYVLKKYKLLDIWYTPVLRNVVIYLPFGEEEIVEVYPGEEKVVTSEGVYKKKQIKKLINGLFPISSFDGWFVKSYAPDETKISIGCKTGTLGQLKEIYKVLNNEQ